MILIRRLSVCACLVWLRKYPILQMTTTSMVIIMWIGMQIWAMPFHDNNIEALENLGLITCIVYLFSGLLVHLHAGVYTTGGKEIVNETMANAAVIIAIGLVLVTLLVAIYVFSREFVQGLLNISSYRVGTDDY